MTPPLPERVGAQWPELRGLGVVAVSGGADSVALVHLLHALSVRKDAPFSGKNGVRECTPHAPREAFPHAPREEYTGDRADPPLVRQSLKLVIAHLNHRMRGADSDGDELFVRELADRLGLPCHTASRDIEALAQATGDNREDLGRRARYDWLGQLAKELGAEWVATGHTADDQAETVLHRLLRGAGMGGLRGIARRRELAPGIDLVRPILHLRRSELVAFLHSINQTWREDGSNRDLRFTRNRIRHELLPTLESYNPAVRSLLERLSEQASEAFEEQEYLARLLLTQAELPRAGSVVVLLAAPLLAAPGRRVRSMFRLLWERERWPRGDMTVEHWKRLLRCVAAGKTAEDFPGGMRVRYRKGVLQIQKT